MQHLKDIVNGFLCGLRDSLSGFLFYLKYDKEPPEKPQKYLQETDLARRRTAQIAERKQKQSTDSKNSVRYTILQCCLLNGGVFGISLLICEYFSAPLLSLCHNVIPPSNHTILYSILGPTLLFLLNCAWLMPLFVLSRIINIIWFQDIANSAYRQRQGHPQAMSSVSKFLADMLISIVIQLFFLIQANMMLLLPLPYINVIVSGIHMSLLNALYAFEYRWFNMGWELYKRLSFIEENWPYFLGFGMPLAVITMYFNSIYVSGSMFATLFPVFIISAHEADPVLNNTGIPCRLFTVVVGISNRIVQCLVTSNPPHTPNKGSAAQPFRSNIYTSRS